MPLRAAELGAAGADESSRGLTRPDAFALETVSIVGAPLAGGPSTPALAAAVSEAGGLGFVAAGYKSAADVAREIEEVRQATERPFGVNVFFPTRLAVDEAAIEAYAERLEAEAERYGVACGEPRWTDDDWDAKLELVARERPAVVSFAFGCPEREVVASLQGEDVAVWCTVTTTEEAASPRRQASTRSSSRAPRRAATRTRSRRRRRAARPAAPVAARPRGDRRCRSSPRAGSPRARRRSRPRRRSGRRADRLGVDADARGRDGGRRSARRSPAAAPTVLTRAFTGRRARAVVNRFVRDHDEAAPKGYPQVHNLTAPLRAAARAAGDADGINLWAGTAYGLARAEPAGDVVERLSAGAGSRPLSRVALTVVGSVNLDLVARVERLPRAGETLTAVAFERIPGGKGANQAVAAARLGAEVRFVGAVGRDAAADEALVNLRALDLDVREVDAPTGLALIVVDEEGRQPDRRRTRGERRGRCVVGVRRRPVPARDSRRRARAGARERRLAVRERRAGKAVRRRGGSRRREPLRARVDRPAAGARRAHARRGRRVLLEDGNEVAAPAAEGRGRRRHGRRRCVHRGARRLAARGTRREEALERACAAGAIAASRSGAQPSLPTADEVDAILRR